ncbi:Cytochrome P450 82C2 [Morella rubra]|uniref:Cytochrome P450 82C2 n=1 Tax=Morella rubra TaxID=262757 RepID=A0A6A1UJU7_9ROSI|nr:Cytochrome P450 82C2 [Morella rubra]
MENTAILREWFGRVDTEKTGSVTAPQLKRALAVGNLDFALTVVQQMIRSAFSVQFVFSIRGFDFTTPLNMPVDMTEGLGVTLPRATPLEVLLAPRLSSKPYEC